ncbi:MAG: hypothetical protein WA197_09940, partial [Candidatus Acidiferrales bacterium]
VDQKPDAIQLPESWEGFGATDLFYALLCITPGSELLQPDAEDQSGAPVMGRPHRKRASFGAYRGAIPS